MTRQTIEAVVDGLRAVEYKYADDAVNASVAVVECGTVVNTWHDGSLVITTINLTKVLREGETHHLTYRTEFAYSSPPELAFRRGLSSQIEIIEIKVRFDPAGCRPTCGNDLGG